MDALFAYLLLGKRVLSSRMTALQMLRLLLGFLADGGLTKRPMVLPSITSNSSSSSSRNGGAGGSDDSDDSDDEGSDARSEWGYAPLQPSSALAALSQQQ